MRHFLHTLGSLALQYDLLIDEYPAVSEQALLVPDDAPKPAIPLFNLLASCAVSGAMRFIRRLSQRQKLTQ